MIFVTFIMLNLFIAIILEGFQKQLTEEAQDIQPEVIDEFVNIWKELDPTASGMILIDDLEQLVLKII
jgi:regulatory protein YycI of two-component signal transduction system YycFG